MEGTQMKNFSLEELFNRNLLVNVKLLEVNWMDGIKNVIVRPICEHGDVAKLVESYGKFGPSEFQSKKQKNELSQNTLSTNGLFRNTPLDIEKNELQIQELSKL